MELRNLNNDVLHQQIDGDRSLKDSDSFKKHYATVLVQLKEAGGQACGFLNYAQSLQPQPPDLLFKLLCSSIYINVAGFFCFGPIEGTKYLYRTSSSTLAQNSSKFRQPFRSPGFWQ